MKIAISVDDSLPKEVDKCLDGLRPELDGLRPEKVLSRLNEAYADGLSPAEERLLKDIKEKVRPLLQDRW